MGRSTRQLEKRIIDKKNIDREMQLRYSLSPVATAAELKNRVFEN
jgi:hypothetical protein